jgi:hypothetical protein
MQEALATIMKGMRDSGRTDVPVDVQTAERREQLYKMFFDDIQETKMLRKRVNELSNKGYRDNAQLLQSQAEMKRVIGRSQQEIQILRQQAEGLGKQLKKMNQNKLKMQQTIDNLSSQKAKAEQQVQNANKRAATCLYDTDKPMWTARIQRLQAQSARLDEERKQALAKLEASNRLYAEQSQRFADMQAKMKTVQFEQENMQEQSRLASQMMLELRRVKAELAQKDKQNQKLAGQLDKTLRQVDKLSGDKRMLETKMAQPQASNAALAALERRYQTTSQKLEQNQRKLDDFARVEANLRAQNQNLRDRLSQVSSVLGENSVAMSATASRFNASQQLQADLASQDPMVAYEAGVENTAIAQRQLAEQRRQIEEMNQRLRAMQRPTILDEKKTSVIRTSRRPADLKRLIPVAREARAAFYAADARKFSAAQAYLVRKASSPYDDSMMQQMLKLEADKVRAKTLSMQAEGRKSAIMRDSHRLARNKLLGKAGRASSLDDLRPEMQAYSNVVRLQQNSIQEMQADLRLQVDQQQQRMAHLYDSVLPQMSEITESIENEQKVSEKLYGRRINLRPNELGQQRLFDDLRSQAEVEIAESEQRLRMAESRYAALDIEFSSTLKALKEILGEEDLKRRDALLQKIKDAKEERIMREILDREAEAKDLKVTANIDTRLNNMDEEIQAVLDGKRRGDTFIENSNARLGSSAGDRGFTTVIVSAGFGTSPDSLQSKLFVNAVTRYLKFPGVNGPFNIFIVGLEIKGDQVVDLMSDNGADIKNVCSDVLTCLDGKRSTSFKRETKENVGRVIQEYFKPRAGFYPVLMLEDTKSGSRFVFVNVIIGDPNSLATAQANVSEQKWTNFLLPALAKPNVSIQAFLNYDGKREEQNQIVTRMGETISRLTRV